MKATDIFENVGRPVLIYPLLNNITGSTNATIFFCQLLYWTGRQRDSNGWIFKTSMDLEKETGLTYKEQVCARKKLVKQKLLLEKHERLKHRMLFKVNKKEAQRLWSDVDSSLKLISPDSPIESEESTSSEESISGNEPLIEIDL